MARFKPKYMHIGYGVLITFFSILPVLTWPYPFSLDLFVLMCCITIMCYGLFYAYYGFLIPKILLKRKVKLFWTIIGLTIAGYPAFWIISFNILRQLTGNKYMLGMESLLSVFLYTILFMTFGSLFRLGIEQFKSIAKGKELENKNMQSELALLRSQINPHFLFNTLNNIHSYAFVDAEMTAYSIEKLSDIMRYMLYESNTEKVLLEREIDYIKSYVDLLNLKFKEKDFVKLDIKGNFEGKQISPMLLIPFVENAFKHGKKKVSHPGIVIEIEIKDTILKMSVENTFSINQEEENREGGIGLQNIKRRLALLYPESHDLIIDTQNDRFVVHLVIKQFDKIEQNPLDHEN